MLHAEGMRPRSHCCLGKGCAWVRRTRLERSSFLRHEREVAPLNVNAPPHSPEISVVLCKEIVVKAFRPTIKHVAKPFLTEWLRIGLVCIGNCVYLALGLRLRGL